MKQTRQQQLARWLKQQSKLAQRWLRLSLLLGVVSGFLIVAQAWVLATLLHALIIESLFKILCKCLSSEVTVKAVTEIDNKATHCHTPSL